MIDNIYNPNNTVANNFPHSKFWLNNNNSLFPGFKTTKLKILLWYFNVFNSPKLTFYVETCLESREVI